MAEPPTPRLPDALLPVLVKACRRAMEFSAADGRLMFEEGKYDYLQNMTGIACLAAVLVTEHPDNPLYRNDQLADLVRRAGKFMTAHHLSPKTNPPGSLWYERTEVYEWAFELWMTAYRALKERGAAELTDGWLDGLRAGGETFYRWIREIRHVRTAISPNLHISPNHFGFFILNTLEAGLALSHHEYREEGMERAFWLTRQQDPDGYWEETDGPTTSYNFISTAAVGWYYALTGEGIFREAVRRALDFHTRFTYPNGSFVETIDQRVRYRPRGAEAWTWVMQAFSQFPEGRAVNEYMVQRFTDYDGLVTSGHRVGRLAKDFLYYTRGDVGTVPAAVTQGRFQLRGGNGVRPQGKDIKGSDPIFPAGVLKRGPWAIGLCGIPSRSRSHRYTLDRQNLLSVYHEKTGLLIGGGGSRNQPEAATFHKRVEIDPHGTVDGVTEMDSYIPTRAALNLRETGGTLAAGYWGFDAELGAEIVNERMLRLTAGAWGRERLMPIYFSPNIYLQPGVEVVTAGGKRLRVDGSAFTVSGEELGGWFGQGAWRITAPRGATLTYPLRPYYPNTRPEDVALDLLYAVLTVPISNETVVLEVQVS